MSQIQKALDTLQYLIGLLRRNAPIRSNLLILGSILSGFATPVIVWAMTGLVDVVNDGATEPKVFPWLLAFAIALLLRSVNVESSRYLASIIRERVDGVMQRDVAYKSIRIPLSAFESREYYDKLETGRRAIGRHLVDVLNNFGSLMSASIGAAGLLVLYAQAHWSLAIILVATMLVSTIVGARQASRFIQVNYRSSPQRQEIDYWAGLLSSRQAAAEIRAFQLGNTFLTSWRRAFDRHFAAIENARFRLAIARLLSICVQELIIWTISLMLVVLAMNETISVGAMVALLYGSARFRELMQSASFGVSQLVQHLSYLQHLREFLALADAGEERDGRLRGPQPFRHNIQFHGVSFTYPGSDRSAVSDLNLTIYPGERVALVGENGAGKSTVVRLLLGLYQPTQGRITVDGLDLAKVDPALWRLEMAAVFQDFMRYPLTVYENIGFGQISFMNGEDSHASARSEIVEAAQKSGAHSFVQDLPFEYRTLLSREFDGGVELSIGQWQRLAMARAYVRKNTQIIVLDEPTSALDPKAEVQVYQQFRSAAEGRCAVFISHRLGSARLADRILVLKAGRLVEEGSHEALLQASGEYAEMYHLQASWYTEEDGEVAG